MKTVCGLISCTVAIGIMAAVVTGISVVAGVLVLIALTGASIALLHRQ